jgi:hypothetical protein
MAFDLVNFMDSLASFIAQATGLSYANKPRAIWRNQAEEADAATPFSVLRCYDGSVDFVPLPTPSIQVETIGSNDAAVNQAVAIYRSLCDANGRPLRMATISNRWRINGVKSLRMPGLVGVDEKDRAKVVFNFDCELCELTPA